MDNKSTDTGTIRPFRVSFNESDLIELRQRIQLTRLPEKEPVFDMSQGVPLATVRKLIEYWTTDYDWRKVEAKINSFPNFITDIDGLDIHFIHVRSRSKDALPLLILHGWPGTIVEHLKNIEPLTNPTAFGGNEADAFDVVIPSMPGYGFSGKPATTGWDHARIARAYAVLMKRLGYTRYAAQGGDWGALVLDILATQGHPELIGIHSNMPGVVPPMLDAAMQSGEPIPAGLSADERQACEMLRSAYQNIPYAYYMASRPQTLYGAADSPVGMAAWLIDAIPRSRELMVRAFDRVEEGLTRDDVLDMCTLFWLTNTFTSAARLYRENKTPFFAPKGVTLPAAVSVFPDELYQAPQSWAESAYPNLMYFNKVAKGGHFAAWEQPTLFTEELRAGLRPLRKH
jgi:pimeloyl-ACP methyl ester carboxylesterase